MLDLLAVLRVHDIRVWYRARHSASGGFGGQHVAAQAVGKLLERVAGKLPGCHGRIRGGTCLHILLPESSVCPAKKTRFTDSAFGWMSIFMVFTSRVRLLPSLVLRMNTLATCLSNLRRICVARGDVSNCCRCLHINNRSETTSVQYCGACDAIHNSTAVCAFLWVSIFVPCVDAMLDPCCPLFSLEVKLLEVDCKYNDRLARKRAKIAMRSIWVAGGRDHENPRSGQGAYPSGD